MPLRTFTIITMEQNRLVAQVHNRMPVVLARADEAAWLGEGPVGTGEVLRLLRPYSARAMEMYAVDTAVNRASVDSPELSGVVGVGVGSVDLGEGVGGGMERHALYDLFLEAHHGRGVDNVLPEAVLHRRYARG